MSNALERAFKIVGGKSALARELGLSRQQVSAWRVPPIKYIKRIAQITGGKVSETALLREILEKRAA